MKMTLSLYFCVQCFVSASSTPAESRASACWENTTRGPKKAGFSGPAESIWVTLGQPLDLSASWSAWKGQSGVFLLRNHVEG